jgi:hypothetical protein
VKSDAIEDLLSPSRLEARDAMAMDKNLWASAAERANVTLADKTRGAAPRDPNDRW